MIVLIPNSVWVCFYSEKTDGIVKNVKFLNIDLFCDVTNPNFTPQITLNSPKMQ